MKRVKAKIIVGLLTLVVALGLSNSVSAADGNYYTVEINNGIDLVSEMSMQDLSILGGIIDPNMPNGIKYGDQIIARIDEATGKIIVDEDLTVDVPIDQQLASRFNSYPDVHLSLDDYDGVRIAAKKEPRRQSSDGSHHILNLYDKPFMSDMSNLDYVILTVLIGALNESGELDGDTFVGHENLTRCLPINSGMCTSDGRPLVTFINYGRGMPGMVIPDGVTMGDNINDVLTEDAKAAISMVIMSAWPWPSSYLNNLNSVTINFVEPPHEEQSDEGSTIETVNVSSPETFDDVLVYVATVIGGTIALIALISARKKAKIARF